MIKASGVKAAFAGAIVMAATTTVRATVYYQLTILGTLGASTSDNGSLATAINDSGVIVGTYGPNGGDGNNTGGGFGTAVGYNTPGKMAFVWTPASPNGATGSMAELPEVSDQTNAAPNSISNNGNISGEYQTTNGEGGVQWTGTSHTVKTLEPSATTTYKSFVVNDSGTVAGWTNSGGAATWTNGVYVGQLVSGPDQNTDLPTGINNAGQISGTLNNKATIFDSSGHHAPVSIDPADSNSYAAAISSNGTVVGRGDSGFIWNPSSANATTGNLTAIPVDLPQAVNEAGTVVGSTGSGLAVSWSASAGIRDIAGDVGDSQIGYHFADALGINSHGQIVGDVYDEKDFPSNTTQLAYLLTPLSTPQAATGHWVGYVAATSGLWTFVNSTSGTQPQGWLASVPRDPGDTAIFGDLLTGDNSGGGVVLQDSLSVGHILMEQPVPTGIAGYVISGADSGTVLTLNNSVPWATGVPSIETLNGVQEIDVNLALTAGATLTTNAGSQLLITGNISGGGMITKAGPGLLTLPRASVVYQGAPPSVGVGVVVTAGEVEIPFSRGSTPYAPMTLPSLSITGGTFMLDTSGGAAGYNGEPSTVLVIGSLAFNARVAGALDLENNSVIVRGGNIAQITAALSTGFNDGKWSGAGIVSSQASADTSALTAVGSIVNGTNGFTLSTFDGQTVSAGDILMKYTYYGDANLDGEVDGSDYSRIDSGYLTQATGWLNGDFNYDGVVNGSDYTLIDNAFNTQGAQLTASIAGPVARSTSEIAYVDGASPVPEPSTLAVVTMATAGVLSRRRSKR